jgi:hypothetical protein
MLEDWAPSIGSTSTLMPTLPSCSCRASAASTSPGLLLRAESLVEKPDGLPHAFSDSLALARSGLPLRARTPYGS